ncbi:MAG: hypothetical protein GTO63_16990 [Anaerolineae bacterium]|nr:hypothetical protein [Anaerolineae bacterium]NIN96493.1 hypothetical protein [Anaerolineae bacterium]NIQ79520.1 hypothetical protein [Anaerolineae bacterium]
MPAIDYKQRLLEDMEGLSDRDWEKLYKVLTLIREEFLEVDDEARYYTESWIAAEREATEVYKRGALRRFKSVQEMADHIEAGIEAEEEDHIYLRNVGGHEILP